MCSYLSERNRVIRVRTHYVTIQQVNHYVMKTPRIVDGEFYLKIYVSVFSGCNFWNMARSDIGNKTWKFNLNANYERDIYDYNIFLFQL